MKNQLPPNPPRIVLICDEAINGLYSCIAENIKTADILDIAKLTFVSRTKIKNKTGFVKFYVHYLY
jgi:hypothetical protein